MNCDFAGLILLARSLRTVPLSSCRSHFHKLVTCIVKARPLYWQFWANPRYFTPSTHRGGHGLYWGVEIVCDLGGLFPSADPACLPYGMWQFMIQNEWGTELASLVIRTKICSPIRGRTKYGERRPLSLSLSQTRPLSPSLSLSSGRTWERGREGGREGEGEREREREREKRQQLDDKVVDRSRWRRRRNAICGVGRE